MKDIVTGPSPPGRPPPRRPRHAHSYREEPPVIPSGLPMRTACQRCLRPEPFCVCRGLAAVTARTRVVILQHPREARLAICSAWLARLSLENAELHRGVRFEEGSEVRALAARPGAAVLFPGEGSTPAEALAGAPPAILFAVD